MPNAFDGRNLILYADCLEVSDGLLSRRIPWLQHYVAAASIAIFGGSTAGVRLLFALLAVLSYWPLYALLRHRIAPAWLWSAVLLAMPQVVLFHRQARYYALATLLFLLLGWLALGGVRRRLPWLLLVLVTLWQLHPLLAASATLALALFAAFYERPAIVASFAAGVIGVATWLIPYALILRPATEGSAVTEALLAWRAGAGPVFLVQSLVATVLDLDYVNALPLLAVLGTGVLVLQRGVRVFRDPLVGYCAAVCVSSIVLAATVAGAEGLPRYAPLRLMPQVALFASLALILALRRIGPAAASIGGALLFVNAGALSLWFPYLPRPALPPSWWIPVYREIVHPPSDPWFAARDFLRARAAPGGVDLLRVAPAYSGDVFRYYVGDWLIVAPALTRGSTCEAVVRQRAGEAAYKRWREAPQWQAVFAGSPPPAPEYRQVARFPSGRLSADGTRPELTRHFFVQDGGSALVLFQREN